MERERSENQVSEETNAEIENVCLSREGKTATHANSLQIFGETARRAGMNCVGSRRQQRSRSTECQLRDAKLLSHTKNDFLSFKAVQRWESLPCSDLSTPEASERGML